MLCYIFMVGHDLIGESLGNPVHNKSIHSLTNEVWSQIARRPSQVVESEYNSLLEEVEGGNKQKHEKVGDGHVKEEQIIGLKSQELVPCNNDNDGQVAQNSQD